MKQRLIFLLISTLLHDVRLVTAFIPSVNKIPASKIYASCLRSPCVASAGLLPRPLNSSQQTNPEEVVMGRSSSCRTIRKSTWILSKILPSVGFNILSKVARYRKEYSGLLHHGRKWIRILFATCVIWIGTGSLPSSLSSRAHASSPTVVTQGRLVPSSKDKLVADRMVEKYLRKYMFQDDVYDSFESTYREVFSDATSGQYPSALADTASFAMGRKKDVQQALKIRTSTDKVLFSKISVIQDMLLNRYGISKAVSRPILFVFGILVPLFSLFFLATTFALNQKVMTERMAVKRYGESILSAEEKPEDDEEEEEDDDDDDDDEDEDDQEGGNKDGSKNNKK